MTHLRRGRPAVKEKKVKITMRLKPETAKFIIARGKAPGMTQARVVEIACFLHGKEVKFKFGSPTP